MDQKTLLVFGSAPNPRLPRNTYFDALACANASGYMAARMDLPTPRWTVMSVMIFRRQNKLRREAMRALAGLATEELILFPRKQVSGLNRRCARQGPAWTCPAVF